MLGRDLVEQLLHSAQVIDAFIVDKAELGGVTQPEPMGDFAPHEARRTFQCAHEHPPARLVAALEQADVHEGASEVGRHFDARYDCSCSAWILHLGCEKRCDFSAHALSDAPGARFFFTGHHYPYIR
jgi:hypothetical protein